MVPEYGLSTHVPSRYYSRPYYPEDDYAAAWGRAETSMWGNEGYLPFTATEGYAYGFSRHPYGSGAYGYHPSSMPVDFGARTVQVPAATPQGQYVRRVLPWHPVQPVAPVLWHRPAYTTVHSPPRVVGQREYVANVTESKIQRTNWERLTTSPKKN